MNDNSYFAECRSQMGKNYFKNLNKKNNIPTPDSLICFLCKSKVYKILIELKLIRKKKHSGDKVITKHLLKLVLMTKFLIFEYSTNFQNERN